MKISRRDFLKSGIAAFAVGSVFPPSISQTYEIELVELNLSFPNLPTEFDGYRIGFLTDFHLGGFVPHEWVAKSVELIKSSNVNLLLLGGDYAGIADSSISKLFGDYRNKSFANVSSKELPFRVFSDVEEIVSSLSPPDGIYAILGNHERRFSPDACEKVFAVSKKIKLLKNQWIKIHKGLSCLELVGVDDYLTAIPRIPEDLPAQSQNFRILLCHNPDYVSLLLEKEGYTFSFNLALCGHTHGGQIRLPFIGAISYNIKDLSLGRGLQTRSKEGCTSQVYTSRGIGMVELPFRINCPPEATVINLYKDKSS